MATWRRARVAQRALTHGPRAATPLFALNHTEAMLRDLTGRLRREWWLVGKRRRYLDLGLQLAMAYRNLVRRRFDHDKQPAAQRADLLERRLTPGEVLGWRQDRTEGARARPLQEVASPAGTRKQASSEA